MRRPARELAVQRVPALELDRPVEQPAKLVWQRVQRLVLRLMSFVVPFCVPLVLWVDNCAHVFLSLLKSPVGLENFVSDSCFREIEVESSVFEFWSVFVLRLFFCCCECPTVFFNPHREHPATYSRASLLRVLVFPRVILGRSSFGRNFGLAPIHPL